jgi:hypothetical protein
LDQSRLDVNSWSFERPEVLDLRDKINSKGTKLKEIPELRFNRGVVTGFNEAFVISETIKDQLIKQDLKSNEIIKPLLRGKDVKKWNIDYKKLYLLFTRRGINIDDYPAVKTYLKQFKEKLTPRNEGQKIGRKPGDYEWFEIQDSTSYYQEFEKNKLIYPNLAPELFVVFDENKFYTNQKCFIITSNSINLKYLGILLSSKTLNFVLNF